MSSLVGSSSSHHSSSSSDDSQDRARRKLGLGSSSSSHHSSSSSSEHYIPRKKPTSTTAGPASVMGSSSSSSSDDGTPPIPIPRQIPKNIGTPTSQASPPPPPPPAAKGTTLELVGSYILRGGAGLLGGVTYGSLFLVGILTTVACAVPIAAVALPFGAIGALVGLCVNGDYENGFNFGILIPGLPLVFLLAIADLPKFALCRSLGYLGAGALAFSITGELKSPGAEIRTQATELLKTLLDYSCVGIGFFN